MGHRACVVIGLAICLAMGLGSSVASAETFAVGDKVEVFCCTNPTSWVPGVVEGIQDIGIKVRFGPRKYDFQIVAAANIRRPGSAPSAKDEAAANADRDQFRKESEPFWTTVQQFAGVFDAGLRLTSGFTDSPAAYATGVKQLHGLDAVCKKHPNLTDPPRADKEQLGQRPTLWCTMAGQADALPHLAGIHVARRKAEALRDQVLHDIKVAMDSKSGTVFDPIQDLMFDRDAWTASERPKFEKRFREEGETLPAEILEPVFAAADDLRKHVEAEAEKRSWEKPPYHDASLEQLGTAEMKKRWPGTTIHQSGMQFITWKTADDTSLVASGTEYKVYRTEKDKYRFKIGVALIKRGKQPLCQLREFSIEQARSGGGYGGTSASAGTAGVYARCP